MLDRIALYKENLVVIKPLCFKAVFGVHSFGRVISESHYKGAGILTRGANLG